MKPDSFVPNPLSPLPWLERFCTHGDLHSQCPTPFRLDSGYAVGTDARIAVFYPTDASFPPFAGHPKAVPEYIAKYLASFPTEFQSVPTASLSTVLGNPILRPETVTPSPCPNCKGTATVPHNCGCELCDASTEDCPTCDGDGTIELIDKGEPDPNPRNFGPITIDANLLAYLIRYAPPSPTIEFAHTQKTLYIRYGETRAIIQGMIHDPKAPNLLETNG